MSAITVLINGTSQIPFSASHFQFFCVPLSVTISHQSVTLSRIVALKLLPFGPAATPEAIQRFRAEASAAASLQHPGRPALHRHGIRRGRAPLHHAAQNEARPQVHRRLLKSVAETVQFAHEHGILHRDLKPANILIDNKGNPRVTYFGLAKRLDEDSDLTLIGQVLGSPNYMSPELAAAILGVALQGWLIANWIVTNGGITAIAAGLDGHLALKTDGTVRAWGRPNYTAALPPNLTNVIAIASGDSHALALIVDP